MIFTRFHQALGVIVAAFLILCGSASDALASSAPVKLVLENKQFGAFANADGTARGANGNIYVADGNNQRIVQFTAEGSFVSMFGWDVNETKDAEPSATQVEKNLCTAASGNTCKAGVSGAADGQFDGPSSLAIDPASGIVYVLDFFNSRIEEFTSEGAFIRVITGSPEHGLFKPAQTEGSLLSVDSKGVLYLGDEKRVQEFEADGQWKGEISLTVISPETGSKVVAMAIGPSSEVFIVYRTGPGSATNIVRRFDVNGNEVGNFNLLPRQKTATAAEVHVNNIAVNAEGRLAVTELEKGFLNKSEYTRRFGSLYNPTTGHRITEFVNPELAGMTFDPEGHLYATESTQMVVYRPVPVAELTNGNVICNAGKMVATDATFKCALNGTIDPFEVPQTEVFFEWGRTEELGTSTEPQVIKLGEGPVLVAEELTGLGPDEPYYYRLAAFDENVRSPEVLLTETTQFITPVALPVIIGKPEIEFAGPTEAVMFAELNPENAATEYYFQYGPCENLDSCQTIKETEVRKSSLYGAIGVTLEATNLQPDTSYQYRLVAHNAAGIATGQQAEKAFRTATAPKPQAITGGAAEGVNTARIEGSVDPDGRAATYRFELGIDSGEATQYAVLYSGSAGSGMGFVHESLEVTGLQPSTEYLFRIAIESGYISAPDRSVLGSPVRFKTQGVPELLDVPTALPFIAVRTTFPSKAKSCAKTHKKKCTSIKKHAKRKRRGGRQRPKH